MPHRDRRTVLATLAVPAALCTGWLVPLLAKAQALPGVSATELKIGSTTSLSGPVSALGTINKAQLAYFKMLNEQGGIAGRKINYIIDDDGFAPPKTLEQTHRLIEQDEVAFLFAQLGTGPNSASVKLRPAPALRRRSSSNTRCSKTPKPSLRCSTKTMTWAVTLWPVRVMCWAPSTTAWSRPRRMRSLTPPSTRS